MNRVGVFVALGIAGILGREANAQIIAEERPPLDSLTQTYHDAMVVMRDELANLRNAADRATRNAPTAAAGTLANHATRLREACRATALTATEQVRWFVAADAASHLVDRVAGVANALEALSDNLTGQCVETFNDAFVAVPDSVREWTPHYTRQLQRFAQQYLNVANALARGAGFRVEPRTGR